MYNTGDSLTTVSCFALTFAFVLGVRCTPLI